MFELKQSQFIEWKNETLAATIDFPKNLVFGKQVSIHHHLSWVYWE